MVVFAVFIHCKIPGHPSRWIDSQWGTREVAEDRAAELKEAFSPEAFDVEGHSVTVVELGINEQEHVAILSEADAKEVRETMKIASALIIDSAKERQEAMARRAARDQEAAVQQIARDQEAAARSGKGDL